MRYEHRNRDTDLRVRRRPLLRHREEHGVEASTSAQHRHLYVDVLPVRCALRRDGGGTNYAFDYDGKEFRAVFSYDTWTVFDSYKIVNEDDIKIICRALADIHPVHGSDRISYRTEEDMAYEWLQHNIAFMVLPKDDPLLEDAKNVDLDPADQGRSFREIYEDRTGK